MGNSKHYLIFSLRSFFLYDWRNNFSFISKSLMEKIAIQLWKKNDIDEGEASGGGGKKKKSKSGSIAAGILVPLFLIGFGAAGYVYVQRNGMPDLGGMTSNFGGSFGGSQKFISTSSYEAADSTDFTALQPAPGSGPASL